MKKSILPLLLIAGAAVGWASFESWRLMKHTQQVAESQQLQLRTAASLEASRAKNVRVAHSQLPAASASTQQ